MDFRERVWVYVFFVCLLSSIHPYIGTGRSSNWCASFWNLYALDCSSIANLRLHYLFNVGTFALFW